MHIIYMMIYLNVSAHSTFKVNNNKRTKLKLLGGGNHTDQHIRLKREWFQNQQPQLTIGEERFAPFNTEKTRFGILASAPKVIMHWKLFSSLLSICLLSMHGKLL